MFLSSDRAAGWFCAQRIVEFHCNNILSASVHWQTIGPLEQVAEDTQEDPPKTPHRPHKACQASPYEVSAAPNPS